MYKRKLIFKYIFISSIFTTLLLCVVTYTGYIKKNFPENIYITEQSNTTLNLSINSLNFPLFSRLPAIENSIYVSFSLVFALMG